jgi:predicted nuclease of predicted toxin-antitoxin system
LGLRNAEDEEIFRAAKLAGVVILTKDADFPHLLNRFGPPPQVLWLTSGNTSNERLQQVQLPVLPAALELLAAGEPLAELGNTLRQEC